MLISKKRSDRYLVMIGGSLLIVAVGVITFNAYRAFVYGPFIHQSGQTSSITYQTPQETDNIYVRFDMEAYDSIKKNYWDALTDAKLAQLFQASAGKAVGALVPLPSPDRAGTAAMLESAMTAASSSPDGQRKFALAVLQVALYNLQPLGRSQLDSTAQVVALRNEVSNINPSDDLYGDLGVSSSSAPAEIAKTYQAKVAALDASTSPAAQVEIKQLSHAYTVLANSNTKKLYDQTTSQPTVFSQVIGDTLYVYIKQMAPSTVQEFAWAVDAASTTLGLDSMIVDLRGNIGGALSFAQGFAGLFLGNGQYAFDLYHQGNYEVQRTIFGRFDELDRYRDMAVLTDHQTQSSAELTTEILKHFNIAHSVGVTTAGWGTVENTYPLATDIDPANRYALFLVNSVTLRDDGQPIQDRGIPADVDISNADWRSQLGTYFSSPSLIHAIEATVTEPPMGS